MEGRTSLCLSDQLQYLKSNKITGLNKYICVKSNGTDMTLRTTIICIKIIQCCGPCGVPVQRKTECPIHKFWLSLEGEYIFFLKKREREETFKGRLSVKSWSTSSFELEAEALMEKRDLALLLGVDANGEVDGAGRTPTVPPLLPSCSVIAQSSVE
jgi:hypothetical protein